MRKPFKMPAVTVLPDIKLPEPRISVFVLFLLRLLARLYLFLFYGIAKTVLRGQNDLFAAFKRALEGKSRCIIAFRHPNGGEPQLLTWFFLFKLRRLAARAGVKFARFPHAVFVYGYEVVRWGGWPARFVMPNVGAMPIHHSKLDSRGMERIYRALANGPYPLALAPEGQVSYTTDDVPRLEPGVIRIGFHVADRLSRAGGGKEKIPVEILPVAIHFRFGSWGRLTLEFLIRKIEKYTGVSCIDDTGGRLPYSRRISLSREHLLAVSEKRYGLKSDRELSFAERLDAVISAALGATERILGVKSKGDLFSRMYSLRQICWDRLILPGVGSISSFSGVEQGVMDLAAGEAWHAGRHLEVVDLGWYFRGPVPDDAAPLHRKIEYAQNLWDFTSRTMGGAYSDRISIFPRRVIIQAAPVINLSERLPEYHADRKAAVAGTLKALGDAYRRCIEEVNKNE
jgi:1-acyl-sn-glycerol-3-phosphate acyltransferase